MSRSGYILATGKRSGAGAMLLCLVGAAESLKAQSVLMAPPAHPVTPPAMQASDNTAAGTGENPDHGGGLPQPGDVFQWGPVTAHPHVSYRLLYGDGLQSAPGQPQKSFIQTLSPGVLLNVGTHWVVTYDPSLTFYTSRQFRDSVDHSASVNWGTIYEDWSISFSQVVSIADDPLVETGQQTSTQGYSTSVGASHRLNSAMSVDLGVSQSITSASGFNGSKSWSTMEWLNYEFFPRLDGSIGAGFGYDKVSLGPDMSHESLEARASWRVANKTTVVIHGGAEDRQYLGGGIPDSISPTFGVSIQYQAAKNTSFSLGAERGISPALFGGQARESTTLNVGASQQLLKHFSLSLAGSYGDVSYLTSTAGVAVNRNDSYYSFSSRLGWSFLKRANAALSYQYSMNNSSAAGFSFSSTQLGFELGYAF